MDVAQNTEQYDSLSGPTKRQYLCFHWEQKTQLLYWV